MSSVLANSAPDTRPFLLRFLCRLERRPGAVAYDPSAKLNMLVGQNIPAVLGGMDVKTLAVLED